MGDLRPIEGGRAIQARDVQAEFASDTDELSTEENLAGYFIIVWDDEGTIRPAYHNGKRSPFAPMLLPDILKDVLRATVGQTL